MESEKKAVYHRYCALCFDEGILPLTYEGWHMLNLGKPPEKTHADDTSGASICDQATDTTTAGTK